MKFTENFNLHKTNNRNVELYYLDSEFPKINLNETENDHLSSEILMTPKKVSVKLDQKSIFTKITQKQILDSDGLGIDIVEMTKNRLLTEYEHYHETDLFKILFDNAVTLNSNLSYSGIKGMIFNLFGFKPKIHASHPHFLNKIIFASNKILKETMISPAKWILIPHKLAVIFDDQPNFTYSNRTEVTENLITHLGIWNVSNEFNVYVSHLIKDNWILTGRSSTSPNDKVLTTVVSEDLFNMSNMNNIISSGLEEITTIKLKKLHKTFLIPGSEISYAKWDFVYHKESFVNWFIGRIKNIFNISLKTLRNIFYSQ